MRFVELFAGIGGFRLGLERAGHECVWANEIDPYACRVYRKNWPDGTLYEGDIKSIDPAALPPHELLCAGFPCQPVSLAGRRKAQSDERWLWPEIVRVLRVSRPRYLLLENVPGLLSAGMGDILRDLADGGYDAEWDCIPAAAIGAPHLRYRIFLVGYAQCSGCPREPALADAVRTQQWRNKRKTKTQSHALADATVEPQREQANQAHPFSVFREPRPDLGSGSWWATEPAIRRVAHGVPARVDRLKCLGNAVVPQVIEWIGHRLKGIETEGEIT